MSSAEISTHNDLPAIKPMSEQYIEELLQQNQNIPIQLITINPISISDKSPVSQATWDIYINSTLKKCQKLSDLPLQLEILNTRLMQSNLTAGIKPIFHSIESNSPSDNLNGGNNRRKPLQISAALYYQPKSKFTAKTGTNITNSGQGDGYISLQSRLPTDEIVSLDYRRDTGTNSGTRFSLNSPYLKKTPFWNWKIDAFDVWKNVGVRDIGTLFGIRSWYLNNCNFELSYEFSKRKFIGMDNITNSNGSSKNPILSEYLLIQEGSFIRNCLKSSFIYDKRNNNYSPSKGYLLKFDSEIGMMNNNSKFWKSILEFTWIRSAFENDFITLNNKIKCGYIRNLNPDTGYIHYTDKFQNGGPNDVRSYQLMGLGLRHLGYSLGGDAFIAYGTSIYSRLPIHKYANSNFRLHWFLNGGKLINHNNKPIWNCIQDLSKEHSTSIGMGILLRHPMARFELNFALPLTSHSDDLVRKGFQFGLGFEFL